MKLEKFEADDIDLGNVALHMMVSPMQEGLRFAEKLNKLVGEQIDITVDKHRERRSDNANKMLWSCIGDIAKSNGDDKENIYLEMLKRYGKYTYICVAPHAVEAVKKQWRETEELGDITINGKPAKQLLCYFGSSSYNTKEFAILLDGVLSEMHEMGLETPSEEEKNKALEKWANEASG